MASAISRLNQALPLFPNGTIEDKFNNHKIIGLLEWALPPPWRTKFNMDGYTPSEGSKQQLILACEATERHEKVEPTKEKEKKEQKESKKRKVTFARNTKDGETKKDLQCKLHGKGNHSTDDCWTLKKQAKEKAKGSTHPTRTFSNCSFKKEINSLTKVSKKRKVLEQYAAAACHGLAKLAKAKKRTNDESSSSDESVKSVEIIEHCVKKKPKRKASNKDEVTEPMKKLSLGKAPEDISSNENEFAD
jgi:hypothetical protein